MRARISHYLIYFYTDLSSIPSFICASPSLYLSLVPCRSCIHFTLRNPTLENNKHIRYQRMNNALITTLESFKPPRAGDLKLAGFATLFQIHNLLLSSASGLLLVLMLIEVSSLLFLSLLTRLSGVFHAHLLPYFASFKMKKEH